MASKQWEVIVSTNENDASQKVRRLRVPGGWLYQIAVSSPNDEWGLPVFVPFASATEEDRG